MKKEKQSISEKQIAEWAAKAQKWDALEEKIGKFYPDGEDIEEMDVEGSLVEIGEVAARAFGFL